VTLHVRPAGAADAPAIRAVHLAAFPTAQEADLVERLEADGDAVLSLVAEEARARKEILGHLMLSRMRVTGNFGLFRALGLGPIGVLPDRQRSGLGSALIVEALAMARAGGEELIFVLGEPAFYRRFGFSAEAAAPFESPYAGPYLMALPLTGRALPSAGRADYAPAFASLE